MRKLIASTMTHSKCSLEDTLERLKEAGFDRIELCSAGGLAPHIKMNQLDASVVAEIAKTVKNSGMGVHCINVGEGGFPMDKMELIYALGDMVGAKIITYACGCPVEGIPNEELIKQGAEFNSKLADMGDRYGIICSIEAPHKNSLASNTEEVDYFWSVQDDRVKVTFDTAHLTYSGEDMLALAKRYAPRMAHSHLRDAIKGNSLMRYGEGVVDFKSYLETVKANGYDGWFSMEYPSQSPEDAAEKLAASVKYLSQFDI